MTDIVPGRRDARVVVDPAVSREAADLLRANHALLARVHRGWRPPPKSAGPILGLGASIVAGVIAASLALYGLALFAAGRYTSFAVSMTGAALLTVGLLLRPRTDAAAERRRALEREVHEHARGYEGHYVLDEHLDEPARDLLDRAARAVGQVMASRVNAEGLLDDVRNAVMLPAQEWEIARLLAKLSALRAEHQEVIAEGMTPEVAAVAGPLAEVLDRSEAAVLARVEALERYAGHVADAERAYRARRQIERLSARLPRYEELLVESGADGSAVPELDGLAEDAGRLEQALRDSVSSAHEAFRHLEG
ncbi:hypothetical protein Nocox_18645 [Nonomuraea coxensis DSM 45129]|uniref:5-bromo-4-chloroindolyl phosphate hydrolysis protein n=1 Tax=Nonomuraea coxensis DSM 45129 TaxID=1122611 RepID=A0ABX8U3W2_9ACTN|nr:hypothetical protein [Nonomuraea coxensis]QYC41338.1 hypothetical protein Nocox_18645 [Nonomuraea coxensis DSM 45129]